MTSESKEQLIEQFSQWLDAQETMPAEEGNDAVDDSAVDLFSLYTELAGLKNEVRLESRQLKNALEKFSEVFDTLQQSNERQARTLDTLREANALSRSDAESRLLLDIIDLRDRIEAGQEAAKGYRATGLARLSSAPAEFIQSLSDGMGISLRRLDELLSRYRVQPVISIGQRLDPDTMQAHSVESHPELPEGQVVSELRKGYTRNGERLRLAEVVVNKHSASR